MIQLFPFSHWAVYVANGICLANLVPTGNFVLTVLEGCTFTWTVALPRFRLPVDGRYPLIGSSVAAVTLLNN